MEEAFLMRSVMYDSVQLSDKLQYDFFADQDDIEGERITSVIESAIIKWFFNGQHKFNNYLFYEELGIDKSTYNLRFFEVRKPIIIDNGKPGDIDILLIDEKRPDLSIAFEVKRVKAIIDTNDRVILKTSKLATGILQARHLYKKYRFHKTFFMPVLVTDSANRTYNQQMFRYPDYSDKKAIYYHNGFGDLPEDVGIFLLEINQPSKNSKDLTGAVSSKMLRFANAQDQSNNTTESVQKLLKGYNA